jgi:hypothetical protein
MRRSDREVLSNIEQYISITKGFKKPKGYYYDSIYHFIRENSKFYDSSPLTKEELAHVNKVKKSLGFVPQIRQCFYNSQMMMLNDYTGQIKYTEGYANFIMPVNHAWNTINGKVIDLTWKDTNDKNIYGTFSNKLSYYGTEFSSEMIRKRMLETEMANSVFDYMHGGIPMLKTKFKI